MREEEETRESNDTKNGNGSEGSKKFGEDYGISLPWPQDCPPDEKLLRGFMREEEETREIYDIKNENGCDRSKKFGIDYSILIPWPQDRPPKEKLLQG